MMAVIIGTVSAIKGSVVITPSLDEEVDRGERGYRGTPIGEPPHLGSKR